MANDDWPDLDHGFRVGILTGLIAGLLWFIFCCWAASLPAVSPVSLSLAFRPWWTNGKSALAVFVFFFTVIGFLAAIRPKLANSDRRTK